MEWVRNEGKVFIKTSNITCSSIILQYNRRQNYLLEVLWNKDQLNIN